MDELIRRRQQAADLLPWGFYFKNGYVKEDLECRAISEKIFGLAADGMTSEAISKALKFEDNIEISGRKVARVLKRLL